MLNEDDNCKFRLERIKTALGQRLLFAGVVADYNPN